MTGFPEMAIAPSMNTPPPHMDALPKIAPPFIVNKPLSSTYTPPPPFHSDVLPKIAPPFIVNKPLSFTYTPQSLQPETVPPFIVNAPPSRTYTPPNQPDSESGPSQPEIAPPVIVNVPPPCTSTPEDSLVMAPAPSTPFVSVRCPPPISMAKPLSLNASVWPFRSSVTEPVISRGSSPSTAATSSASVTVPPASSWR